MEAIVELMQDQQTGIPVRTVKSFMTKIPSVFTGKSQTSAFVVDNAVWFFQDIATEL